MSGLTYPQLLLLLVVLGKEWYVLNFGKETAIFNLSTRGPGDPDHGVAALGILIKDGRQKETRRVDPISSSLLCRVSLESQAGTLIPEQTFVSARGDTSMEFYKGQTFTILGQPYWLVLTMLLRQLGKYQSLLLYQICTQ